MEDGLDAGDLQNLAGALPVPKGAKKRDNGTLGVVDDGPGPVKPGDTGTYGGLKGQKKKYGETEPMDMDHQPSFASQVAAKEAELGRELSAAELKALKNSTPAIASPRSVHQETSPTYGGRNTPEQIANDMQNLAAAQARDRAAFDEAMRNR